MANLSIGGSAISLYRRTSFCACHKALLCICLLLATRDKVAEVSDFLLPDYLLQAQSVPLQHMAAYGSMWQHV